MQRTFGWAKSSPILGLLLTGVIDLGILSYPCKLEIIIDAEAASVRLRCEEAHGSTPSMNAIHFATTCQTVFPWSTAQLISMLTNNLKQVWAQWLYASLHGLTIHVASKTLLQLKDMLLKARPPRDHDIIVFYLKII
jgi:hypothetical protein